MNLTTKTRRAYQDHYAEYGIGPKALQWSSMRSIEMRYGALIDESVDFENKTILEIGPGFGYGIPYIKARAKKFDYTGIDLVPEFVGVAAARCHPGCRVGCRDRLLCSQARRQPGHADGDAARRRLEQHAGQLLSACEHDHALDGAACGGSR